MTLLKSRGLHFLVNFDRDWTELYIRIVSCVLLYWLDLVQDRRFEHSTLLKGPSGMDALSSMKVKYLACTWSAPVGINRDYHGCLFFFSKYLCQYNSICEPLQSSFIWRRHWSDFGVANMATSKRSPIHCDRYCSGALQSTWAEAILHSENSLTRVGIPRWIMRYI